MVEASRPASDGQEALQSRHRSDRAVHRDDRRPSRRSSAGLRAVDDARPQGGPESPQLHPRRRAREPRRSDEWDGDADVASCRDARNRDQPVHYLYKEGARDAHRRVPMRPSGSDRRHVVRCAVRDQGSNWRRRCERHRDLASLAARMTIRWSVIAIALVIGCGGAAATDKKLPAGSATASDTMTVDTTASATTAVDSLVGLAPEVAASGRLPVAVSTPADTASAAATPDELASLAA